MSAECLAEEPVPEEGHGVVENSENVDAKWTLPRLPWPSLTNVWRGAFTLSLGFTVCAIAVAESAGAAEAPRWFLGFAIPVLVEWVGEWVVVARRQ